jgi:hypothetical protein
MKAIALIVVLFLIGGGVYLYEHGTQHTVTFTVKSLEDQPTRNGHQYMVFTTGGQAYENVDARLHGKNDSSNIQAWLTPGHTYACPVYGVRNFLASSYPNILDGCTDTTRGVPDSQRHL